MEVERPITIPNIIVNEGQVFPLIIMRTLDLRYEPIPPKTSKVNEFYYIITVPFKGVAKAVASVCTQPLEGKCSLIVNRTYINVQANDFCKSYIHYKEHKINAISNEEFKVQTTPEYGDPIAVGTNRSKTLASAAD